MNDQETARVLCSLRYADEQTVRMYDLAFPQFVDEPIAEQLQRFRDEHQRHVERIDALLKQYWQQEPEVSHEFMAMVQEHLRMVDRSTNPDDTVHFILLAELTTQAEYDQAAEGEVGSEVARVLREHHAEEQRHVEYLEQRVPVAVGAAAERGYATSPPRGVQSMGPGTGGSLGGAVSGIAPKPSRDTGRACPPNREK